MIILKKFIKNILAFFVFLKYKNWQNLYQYLYEHKQISGIKATVFSHYCDTCGAYIGIGAKISRNTYFPHGINGIFIADNVEIGDNAVIFQQVTIGASRTIGSNNNGSPKIGNNVYIGSGAKIIGNIRIGDNVRIGANAVVYTDVPDNSVVVNSPTKIIKKDEPLDNRFIKNINNQDLYYDFESKTFKLLGGEQ